jgi:general nucleoside transport system permease protein
MSNFGGQLIVALLSLTLIKATPIMYAALGGVISERSGVINIALEGMMIAGAFTAVVCSGFANSAALGLAGGVAAGALLGAVLGAAATIFKADQIVAGAGLNVLAAGAAAYALMLIYNRPGATPQVPAMGESFWILVALAFVCALVLHVVLYATPFGLRVRACGENPRALVDASLHPLRLRLIAVTISGALAGLGGAYLSIGEVNLFSDGMTAGRGFIALAAVIFGRWTPWGATGAALFFGFFEALQYVLQGRVGWLPSDAMQAVPYVAALIAIGGFVGKVRAPAADGVPF